VVGELHWNQTPEDKPESHDHHGGHDADDKADAHTGHGASKLDYPAPVVRVIDGTGGHHH
jgi:hypothetical protein